MINGWWWMPVRVGAKERENNDRKISSNRNGWNAHASHTYDIGVWGMNENILKDIIKELVTEEVIKEAVEKAVKENFDWYVEDAIKRVAQNEVAKYCNKKIEKLLDEIYGKEINVSDGWSSNDKKYKSFEDFVKDYVHSQVNSSYGLENKVSRMLTNKLNEYCKKVVEENTEDLSHKVFEKIAKENG